MKKSLLVLMLLAASAAQASLAPPCDPATFEGQTTCGAGVELTVAEAPPVPEPSTWALMIAGFAAVLIAKRKQFMR
jgi:hypothetical protein